MSPEENGKLDAWLKEFVKKTLPLIRENETMVFLHGDHDLDPKQALELGAMLLLDKPIIVFCLPGAKLNRHMVRVADAIIYGDPKDPEVMRQFHEAIKIVTEQRHE